MKANRSRMGRLAPSIGVVTFLLLSDVYALDESKTDAGADHEDAHAYATGVGARIGVIEHGGNLPADDGIDTAKDHLGAPGGRLARDLDFSGAAVALPLTADPPASIGDSDHGTLVSDVAASSDAGHTGVAPAATVYAGWPFERFDFSSDVDSTRGAVDWYERGHSVDLFNNSWHVDGPADANSELSLFFDWFASTRDVVVVKSAGNNGIGHNDSDNQISQPGGAYNLITVGAVGADFRTRASYSSYWLPGDNGTAPDSRGKPDIVAPGGESANLIANGPPGPNTIAKSGTSFAAPHLTGTSALLIEEGLTLGAAGGHNHLAHKAIILNSARKPFISWPNEAHRFAQDLNGAEASDCDYLDNAGNLIVDADAGCTAGNRSADWAPSEWTYVASPPFFLTQHPLDDELGTGVLDAERALRQHHGGQQDPGMVSAIGWDIDALDNMAVEQFEIDRDLHKGAFITATLTWDRPVTEDDNNMMVDAGDSYTAGSLPDLDIEIYRRLSGTTGLPGTIIVAASYSRVDNVEHVHVPVAATGTYGVRVVSRETYETNYAVAWWINESAAIPGLTQTQLAALGALLLTVGILATGFLRRVTSN